MLRRRSQPPAQPEAAQPEAAVEPPAAGLPDAPAADARGPRSMQQHRDFLLGQVKPLAPFGMSLLDARGLALCEEIASETDLPGFDNCQMDGYAVHAADIAAASEARPIVLTVAGAVAAGEAATDPLPRGRAIRVMTGAPLPEGADAVVPFESTDRGEQQVQVRSRVAAGEFVRRQGSDVARGDVLMRRGQRVDARTIGLLAGAGIDKVLARPRPRVVVVSTGKELVEPGCPLTAPGTLYDANSHLVAAAAAATGCQVWRVQVPSDEPQRLRETISDQLIRADLVVTTGGISEGDHDVVKQVMPSLGRCDFAKVAMQPGGPQGFGLVGEDEVPVVMLPGNPVSSYVSFHAFVRPLIRRLMGVEPVGHQEVSCVAGSVMRSVPGRLQFGRGLVRQEGERRVVDLAGGHSSHLTADLAMSNALVLLGEDVEVVNPGERVTCWMLDD